MKKLIAISAFMFLCCGQVMHGTVTVRNQTDKGPIKFKYTYSHFGEKSSPSIDIPQRGGKQSDSADNACLVPCVKTGYYVEIQENGEWTTGKFSRSVSLGDGSGHVDVTVWNDGDTIKVDPTRIYLKNTGKSMSDIGGE